MIDQAFCKEYDKVIARISRDPLVGLEKLKRIQAVTGDKPFEFIGHDEEDLQIMKAASRVTVVKPHPRLVAQVNKLPDCHMIGVHQNILKALILAMRPHHWVKNLLLGVPLIMAHQWHDVKAWFTLLFALSN